jgi:TonB family protein
MSRKFMAKFDAARCCRGTIYRALLVLVLSVALGAASKAQSTSTDSAIFGLAQRIAKPLQKGHARKILIAELTGPEGQTHPLGNWLAVQLSARLKENFPSLDILDQPPLKTDLKGAVDSPGSEPSSATSQENEAARKLGAKVLITGTFAKASKGIGVSLSALRLDRSPVLLGDTTGLIPISDEITALSADPIPSLKAGVVRSGIGGVSLPTCIYCPSPDYSEEARAAKYQGTVTLLVTVTTDGRAGNIVVVKSPGLGLEEKSIRAVRDWRFKPAIDAEGNLIAAIVPIEVTFRLRH